MNKIFALAIAIILLFTKSSALRAQDSTILIPYRVGDLWGYSNYKKQIKIKPKFQHVSPIWDYDIAEVKLPPVHGKE